MLETLSEGPSTRERPPPAPSNDGSEEEEGEGVEVAPSKFKLSLEEVDGLLGAVHVTLGLGEETKGLTLHDRMYAGLSEPKGHTFLVHSVISDSIKRDWQETERHFFFSKAHNRRFPFEEEFSPVWNKVPNSTLPFLKSLGPLT